MAGPLAGAAAGVLLGDVSLIQVTLSGDTTTTKIQINHGTTPLLWRPASEQGNFTGKTKILNAQRGTTITMIDGGNYYELQAPYDLEESWISTQLTSRMRQS